ncbi:uncharacterized protein NPIL_559731 [Nephila pilipes]|uniref:Uncharacterized protein n=1 Tax=Nephila pilipes TaxID=299642 RepID=A0A8X6KKC5_NEPPI|nr:uncharacterized protein NPIL_559731 [Nephila pilipes]
MATTNVRHRRQAGTCQRVVFFLWICILIHTASAAKKIRYASDKECDRYSLDAVYNERFKPITENIFKDSQEFVNRVSDLMIDSLSSIMASLPDRDSSDNQEKKMFTQFKSLKSAFSSRLKKTQKKISTAWEALIANHFDLMYDNGKATLKEYLNKTQNMTEAYSESRRTLDASMESFVGFVKGVVRDGLQGISLAAEESLKKDEAAKTNATEEGDKSSTDENNTESREDKLMNKKVEIAEMIVQGFLGKITVESIKRKIDLFKKVTINPEDRESVLEDLLFDILMIKNRIRAIIHDDIPNDKGNIDLARRSVYTYWADMAENMYKDKLKAKQSTESGGDAFYKKLWSDENQLVDTLLNLMEIYSAS